MFEISYTNIYLMQLQIAAIDFAIQRLVKVKEAYYNKHYVILEDISIEITSLAKERNELNERINNLTTKNHVQS